MYCCSTAIASDAPSSVCFWEGLYPQISRSRNHGSGPPRLITAIEAIQNANEPDDSAGQAQYDSGYDHPRVGVEPAVEQVTDDDAAEDVRRKQRDDCEYLREFRLFGPVAH